MHRIPTTPRNNWQQAVEQLGFGFHSTNVPYWDESVYYTFSLAEIERIEAATAELWDMCLAAVQHIIDNSLYEKFRHPKGFETMIEASWMEDHPSIYGRFDLCVKDGQIKMLEFNADTPTSLYEAGIVQWYWLQDFDKTKDQFNSIHEKLIGCWMYLKDYLKPGPLHFSCVKGSLEDLTNTEYLRDCAMQAGIDTKLLLIDDLGWDDARQLFVDMEDETIANIFKLYPWEWLVEEEFAAVLPNAANKPLWIEPPWKSLLSNKAILPVLWELFPDHPLLLPAFYEPGPLASYAKKPILAREGANVTLVQDGRQLAATTGSYGGEGYVYQALCALPDFGGNFPVIGSWVIGQQPAGIGIRESDGLITGNNSRFVPHVIDKE